jgi:hypothetical protein
MNVLWKVAQYHSSSENVNQRENDIIRWNHIKSPTKRWVYISQSHRVWLKLNDWPNTCIDKDIKQGAFMHCRCMRVWAQPLQQTVWLYLLKPSMHTKSSMPRNHAPRYSVKEKKGCCQVKDKYRNVYSRNRK